MAVLHLFLFDSIKFFMEGAFNYYVFKIKLSHSLDKKIKIKNTLRFSIPYVLILVLVNYFFSNPITTRLFPAILLFSYLVTIDSQKNWKFVFNYSIFINCILEFNLMISSFITASIVTIINKILNVNETAADLIGETILLLVHLCLMMIIYKSPIINMNAIRLASNKNIVFFFFSFYMIVMTLIKYLAIRFSKTEWVLLYTFVFSFISPLFIYIILIMNKKYEKSNIEENKKEELKIKNSIEQLDINDPDLDKTSLYEKEKNIYSTILMYFGMTNNCKGFWQLIMSIIIVKFSSNKNLKFGTDVYEKVAELTGNKSGASVSINISNAIKNNWHKANLDFISKIYPQYIDPDKGVPTNKEFIMFMAKSLDVNKALDYITEIENENK